VIVVVVVVVVVVIVIIVVLETQRSNRLVRDSDCLSGKRSRSIIKGKRMSLTILIGQYYIQDLDNHNSKTCYIEINHGKQSVRTTSIPFIENNDSVKKGYVANFSHLLELLVYNNYYYYYYYYYY